MIFDCDAISKNLKDHKEKQVQRFEEGKNVHEKCCFILCVFQDFVIVKVFPYYFAKDIIAIDLKWKNEDLEIIINLISDYKNTLVFWESNSYLKKLKKHLLSNEYYSYAQYHSINSLYLF